MLEKCKVFEANSDVLARCNRALKPAEHAREQWWIQVPRLRMLTYSDVC
jgi:hypothetical protein